MSDESAPPQKQGEGAPAWVMTFADLMSLLMCFFVLLLAFSEMDVLKFKQLAGSMKEAFGVQREIKAKEIPKGTSIIAREFSPGKPEPTALNEVRQFTRQDLMRHLQVGMDKLSDDAVAGGVPPVDPTEVQKKFAEEIEAGLIEVDTDEQRIIIRIQEKGAFPSGSATLIPRFQPVVDRIAEVLKTTTGQIVVAGHTDNIPISTVRFRSNWELSAGRSVTVMHYLLKATGLDQNRFVLEGHADTAPLEANDSPENRARNRRVEVVIIQGAEDIEEALPETGEPEDPSA